MRLNVRIVLNNGQVVYTTVDRQFEFSMTMKGFYRSESTGIEGP